MTSENQRESIYPEKTKVSEWIKLLKIDEQIVEQIGKNENLAKSLKELMTALKPYEKCQSGIVIDLIKRTHTVQAKLPIKASVLDGMDLRELSLDRLKILVTNEKLSMNELLLLADKTLKMPIGSLKKLKKEVVRQKILNVIQNNEKLDTIARQAAG